MFREGLLCFCMGVNCLGADLHASTAAAEPALAIRDAEVARRRVDSLVAFLNQKTTADRLAVLGKDHAAAGATALRYLFDDSKYAIPAKAYTGWIPGKDTQPGYEEAERLVNAATAKHNELVTCLAQAMRAMPQTFGDRQPTLKPWSNPVPKVPAYGICAMPAVFDPLLLTFDKEYKAYQNVRVKLETLKAADTEKSADRPLYKALGALASGRYAEARKAGAALEGAEAVFFRLACQHQALAWNASNLQGRGSVEAEAIRIMNLYRIVLGLHPLAHNEKLHKIASDYLQEMDRLNFMAHVHPRDPARKTLGARGKRLGYPDISGECLSSSGKGNNEIWEWRADAGHHRIMIGADDYEVGLAFGKHGVLNTGRGTEANIAALFAPVAEAPSVQGGGREPRKGSVPAAKTAPAAQAGSGGIAEQPGNPFIAER